MKINLESEAYSVLSQISAMEFLQKYLSLD